MGGVDRLKLFDFRVVQLHTTERAAPFGHGFGKERHRRGHAFVFGIVRKAYDLHARFLVGFARRQIAAFDIAARAGDMRAIGRADASLALDAAQFQTSSKMNSANTPNAMLRAVRRRLRGGFAGLGEVAVAI